MTEKHPMAEKQPVVDKQPVPPLKQVTMAKETFDILIKHIRPPWFDPPPEPDWFLRDKENLVKYTRLLETFDKRELEIQMETKKQLQGLIH